MSVPVLSKRSRIVKAVLGPPFPQLYSARYNAGVGSIGAGIVFGLKLSNTEKNEQINVHPTGIEPIINRLTFNFSENYQTAYNPELLKKLLKKEQYALLLRHAAGSAIPCGYLKDVTESKKQEIDFWQQFSTQIIGAWEFEKEFYIALGWTNEVGYQFYNNGNGSQTLNGYPNPNWVDFSNIENYLSIDQDGNVIGLSPLIERASKPRDYHVLVFKLSDFTHLKPFAFEEIVEAIGESFETTIKVFDAHITLTVEAMVLEKTTSNKDILVEGKVARISEREVKIKYFVKIKGKYYYNLESKLQTKLDLFSLMQVNAFRPADASEHGDVNIGDVLIRTQTAYEEGKFVVYFHFWNGHTYPPMHNGWEDRSAFWRAELTAKNATDTVLVSAQTAPVYGYHGREAVLDFTWMTIDYEEGSYPAFGHVAGTKQQETYEYKQNPHAEAFHTGTGTIAINQHGKTTQVVTRIKDEELSDEDETVYKVTKITQTIKYDDKTVFNGDTDILLKPMGWTSSMNGGGTGVSVGEFNATGVFDDPNGIKRVNSSEFALPLREINEVPFAFGEIACIYAPKLVENQADGICYLRLIADKPEDDFDGYQTKRDNYYTALEEWKNAKENEKALKEVQLKMKKEELETVQIPLLNNFAPFELMLLTQPGRTYILLK